MRRLKRYALRVLAALAALALAPFILPFLVPFALLIAGVMVAGRMVLPTGVGRHIAAWTIHKTLQGLWSAVFGPPQVRIYRRPRPRGGRGARGG